MVCTKQLALAILLAVFTQPSLRAEDVRLRQQAVRLLERASAASLIGKAGNYEQVVSFRVYDLDGTTHEGSLRRIVAGAAANLREEENYGDFHGVFVRSGNRVSSTFGWNEPAALREVRQLIPVQLGQFDQTDVIRSVESANVLGRAATCVQFETQFGNTLQRNQICFDSGNGALLRWQVGNEIVENSDFVPFAGLLEPRLIRRYLRGTLRMEVEQTFTTVRDSLDANMFAPPTSQWIVLLPCTTVRRPIAISTPQPPPGQHGTEIVDVVVHGIIRGTGKVDALDIQSSPRPDLNAEALSTVATWKFEPMLCNDKIMERLTDFVVHFQGR